MGVAELHLDGGWCNRLTASTARTRKPAKSTRTSDTQTVEPLVFKVTRPGATPGETKICACRPLRPAPTASGDSHAGPEDAVPVHPNTSASVLGQTCR